MMNRANVPKDMKIKLCKSAFSCATKVDGLTVVERDGKKDTRSKLWCGKNPLWVNNMKAWGEAGTCKIADKSGAVIDKGTTCMFVDCSDGQAWDVCKMWNPTTNGIVDRQHERCDLVATNAF